MANKKRSAPRPDYVVGDLVMLTSGGPIMVVEKLVPPAEDPEWGVKCAWFDKKGREHDSIFYPKTIAKLTAAEVLRYAALLVRGA